MGKLYTVIWGEGPYEGDEKALPLAAALKQAQVWANEGKEGVIVSWYRTSDGQTVYLNQNGDSAPVGKFWKPEIITSEGLVERLPLINAKAVCEKAEVDYNRFKGWKLGRVRQLDEDEMQRIAKVLKSLSV